MGIDMTMYRYIDITVDIRVFVLMVMFMAIDMLMYMGFL